ncbi:MAG: flagellar hook protein FlgE [Spirochaetes bacterium GWF1_41_5]|nr:MAG: flagellar hook protein FlgE [Spirochaetes bacterium GWF1_41_5]
MMRSLYSGVSGLQNHQTRMDVVGNNIGNVNTYGFKKGRANFQDILSQTLTGAARPTEEIGGVNPKQVGLGMTIAAIDTLHTQGALQTTGVNTDVAILGEGFFIQNAGNSTFYSRNGALSVDANGLLVNPANGFKVQGFASKENPDGTVTINKQGGLADIIIPVGAKDAAKATSIIKYQSNMNSLTPVIAANASETDMMKGTVVTTINAYDSRGNVQELNLSFRKNLDQAGAAIPNEWVATVAITDKQGRQIEGLKAGVDAATAQAGNAQFIMTFDTKGAVMAVRDMNQAAGQGKGTGAGESLEVSVGYNVAGSEPMNIRLSLGSSGRYDGVTQFAAPTSTKAYYQDGRNMGYLEGFKIDDSGVITGSYSNGTSKALGQLALATFTNAGGLEKSGESYYVETNNSGMAMVDAPGERVAGKVKAGALEMSNVDLSEEFTSMIVTQRGFQANSRTISTSDEMLRELINLKR